MRHSLNHRHISLSLGLNVTKPEAIRQERHRDLAFGERLTKVMEERDVGSTELADYVPVHPTTVSRWKAGEVPDAPALARVGDYLRVQPTWLKTGEGERAVTRVAESTYNLLRAALDQAYEAGFEAGSEHAAREGAGLNLGGGDDHNRLS